MTAPQTITLDDQLVAVAFVDRLIIDTAAVTDATLATVEAMGLYALEIQAGRIDVDYTDHDALQYAKSWD